MSEDFDQAMKAFKLFTPSEQLRALHVFAGLRCPSIADRFFEAVYRIIVSRDDAKLPADEQW